MAATIHRTNSINAYLGALILVAVVVAVCICPNISRSAEIETAEETIEEAVERTAEKAAEKAVEVVERAAEKAVEKVVEEAAIKAELKANRPDEWMGPTTVHFLIFVVDIDSIDGASQSFAANVYLRLRWKDERLASDGGAIRQIPLEGVWNPQVLLVNQTGILAKSLPEIVQVQGDGTVIYHQRYTGNLSQPLRLSAFPMDKHTFTIQFVAVGYTADELVFLPDTSHYDETIVGGSIADQLSLPDWQILSHEALALVYSPIDEIRTAGFGFRFEAKRYVTYYHWQVVLPLAVVVIMSWAAFWIDRKDVSARIGVATSSILTLIALRFVLGNLLPRLPYMTRMDYFTVGSTLLVLLALIAVILTSSVLVEDRYELYARRINRTSRLAFPSAFLLLLGWFLFM